MANDEWSQRMAALGVREPPRDSRAGLQEPLREDNARMVEERLAHQAREEQEKSDEHIREMAQDNVRVLSNQIADLKNINARFEATGQKPFAEKSEFQAEPDRFSHERGRFETALSQMANSVGKPDPYGTNSRATLAEYAAFEKEQKDLDARIASAPSPAAARELYAIKKIRGMDYVAFTSQRIADQSAVIHGEGDTMTETYRQRAKEMKAGSDKAREQYQRAHGRKVEEAENQASYGRSLESAEQSRGVEAKHREVKIAPTNGVAEWPERPSQVRPRQGAGENNSGTEKPDGAGPEQPSRPQDRGGR
jgi:hypothetical protein